MKIHILICGFILQFAILRISGFVISYCFNLVTWADKLLVKWLGAHFGHLIISVLRYDPGRHTVLETLAM